MMRSGRIPPLESDRVLFFLQGGSFLPVEAVLDKGYSFVDLIGRDEPAFSSLSTTVNLRFEVNTPGIPDDKSTLIGCSVARVPVQMLPSRLADMLSPGES